MSPLLACILATFVGTAAPDKLAPYRGQPVVAVNIDAPAGENSDELKKLVSIKPGFLLGTADLHTSIKRLYSLGRFSNVVVHAKRLAGSVELTFELKPILRVGELDIEGVSDDKETRIRNALGLSDLMEFDSRTETRIVKKAKEALFRMGYRHALVKVFRLGQDAYARIDLQMTVVPGEPTLMSQILFLGIPRISTHRLRTMISLRPGDPFDQLTLSQDLAQLERAYLERGFRTCRVGAPHITMSENGAVIRVDIQAGDRIAIEFVGNQTLDEEQLLALWPDPTQRFRQGDLKLFKRRVLAKYHRFGFYHAKIQIRGFVEEKKGITRYLFKVDEGVPLEIKSLQFQGAKAFTHQELTQHLHSVIQSHLGTDGIVQPLRLEDGAIVAAGGGVPIDARGEARSSRTRKVPQLKRWIPDIYEDGFQDIESAYHNRGYLKAKVGPAQTVIDGTVATVVVPVAEGDQTFINTISFRNNTEILASELLEVVANATRILPGSPLSSSAIENARIALLRMYRDRGYIYCRVFTEVRQNADNIDYDVRFRFEEGLQVRIGEILVRGNRHTRESVIRDRISLRTGDVYKLDTALRDQREITDLGVFSKVQLRLLDEDHPAERKDLVAEVREQNRHRLQLGGGLSTEDGPRVRFSYSHLNLFGVGAVMTASVKLNRQIFFDLYGDAGLDLRKHFESYDATEQLTKAIERELRLGFRSPKFTQWVGSPLLRVDFVNERDNRISYFLDTLAVIFGLEFQPAPWLKIALEPQASITDLECVSSGRCGESITDIETGNLHELGVREGLKIGPIVTLDFRDNPLNPRSGWMAWFDARYAVGRSQTPTTEASQEWWNYAFTKIEGRVTGYIPLGVHVLALSGSGGYIQVHDSLDPDPTRFNSTPLDERFFLGGRSTLRGYLEDSIYPENCSASCNGGQVFALIKSELRVKVTENVTVDLFFEAGNLWSQSIDTENFNLRIGTGAGLSYNTPVGPLTLSIGFNPNPRKTEAFEERPMEWHLAVGQF